MGYSRLYNPDDLIQVDVVNNVSDIVAGQSQFQLFDGTIESVYDAYQKYLQTGKLDSIIDETVNAILQVAGEQTNLYSGSVFNFSNSQNTSLRTIQSDNKYWQQQIDRLNSIISDYIQISATSTFNIFNSLQGKPTGFNYHNCNWNIMHGDIFSLINQDLNTVYAGYDATEFPITILRISSNQQLALDTSEKPNMSIKTTIMHNKGLSLGWYFKLSAISTPKIGIVRLTLINQIYDKVVFSRDFLISQHDTQFTQYSLDLDAKLLETVQQSQYEYQFTLKFQLLDPSIILDITAVKLTELDSD